MSPPSRDSADVYTNMAVPIRTPAPPSLGVCRSAGVQMRLPYHAVQVRCGYLLESPSCHPHPLIDLIRACLPTTHSSPRSSSGLPVKHYCAVCWFPSFYLFVHVGFLSEWIVCLGIFFVATNWHFHWRLCTALSVAYLCSTAWIALTVSPIVGGALWLIPTSLRGSVLLFPSPSPAVDDPAVFHIPSATEASADKINDLGKQMFSENQVRCALKCFDRGHEIYPHDMRFKSNMAAVYMKLKQWEEAVKCCNEALQIGSAAADSGSDSQVTQLALRLRVKNYWRHAKAHQMLGDAAKAYRQLLEGALVLSTIPRSRETCQQLRSFASGKTSLFGAMHLMKSAGHRTPPRIGTLRAWEN